MKKIIKSSERIPLYGTIDLTTECNNDCRHCWISNTNTNQLSYHDIKCFFYEVKDKGCISMNLFGGEPMLRNDFYDIYDIACNLFPEVILNTNGTLITDTFIDIYKKHSNNQIILISLYGASAKTYEYITRNVGSFSLLLNSLQLLKENNVHFLIQLIPLKSNIHEYDDMFSLAKNYTDNIRYGIEWVYQTPSMNINKRNEISAQRLEYDQLVKFVDFYHDSKCRGAHEEEYLFENCIQSSNQFYMDSSGRISFCSFIRDSRFMHKWEKGQFAYIWDVVIPSFSKQILYNKNTKCYICAHQNYCNICPVFNYLENEDYGTPIDYMCGIVQNAHMQKIDKKLIIHNNIVYEIMSSLNSKELELLIDRYLDRSICTNEFPGISVFIGYFQRKEICNNNLYRQLLRKKNIYSVDRYIQLLNIDQIDIIIEISRKDNEIIIDFLSEEIPCFDDWDNYIRIFKKYFLKNNHIYNIMQQAQKN